jgi:hypothetical protein
MADVRVVICFLAAAMLLLGDTFKLFLKDGTYHLVSQYEVQGDRVRYYSTERDDWEEIPIALLDLAKTEQARKAKSDAIAHEAKAEDEEAKAERELHREIASIPVESGAYYNDGTKVKTVPAADYQVITSKKRKAIQMIVPVPLVPGKATVVIKGEHSNFVVSEDRPGFYLRLAKEERFGIVRLEPKKDMRIVENVSIVPVANLAEEERKLLETFDQQLADGLYRVWPEKPLTPGEYALIEFSDNGDKDDIEMAIWDFAVRPAAK